MIGNALLARLAIDSIIMDFFIPLDAIYQLTDQAIIDRLRELELSYQYTQSQRREYDWICKSIN